MEEFETLKSAPLGDLRLTAMAYVYKIEEDGREVTECEIEILDPELHERSDYRDAPAHRCACCGSTRLVYPCYVTHVPTGRGYYVGRSCALKIDSLGRDASNARLTVALKERAKSKQRRRSWKLRHPELVDLVEWAESQGGPARDIASKIGRYDLSERQVSYLEDLRVKAAEREAKLAAEAPTGPAPEGVQTVRAEILSLKWKENDWGGSLKLLGRVLDTNAKIYCTCPSGISGAEKGDIVDIKARFDRSRDDEFFAFGSRPRGSFVSD